MKLITDTTTITKENEVTPPTDDPKTDNSKETAGGKDSFLAKKSANYKTEVSADRDVWCEYLAVVEIVIPGNTGAKSTGPRYELQIKSFFESTHTGKRSWDEPPSGATTIQYATDEEQTRAQNEMLMLQETTQSYVADTQPTTQSYASNDGKGSPRKSSRLNRLGNIFKKITGRKKKGDSSKGGISPETSVYQLKDEYSRNAQIKALKRFEHDAATKRKTSSLSRDEKNAIVMAKALSLSERESNSAAERDSEMIMQNAIYESKSENYSGGTGLAYGNIPHDNLEEGEDEGNDNHLEEILNLKSDVPVGKSDKTCNDAGMESHPAKNDGDFKMPAVKINQNWV